MLKNLLFILFLVIFMLSFSLSVSAQKEVLMKKIYAYYPLNGNIIDQGPHQLHGKELADGLSTEDRFGNKDSALYFSKKGDPITLPVNINPEKMPQLTIALWLKVKQVSEINTVFSNSDGSFARSLVIDSRKNRSLLSVSAGSSQKFYGGISIPLNKWVFTAVSWNKESGQVSLYLADQNRNFSSISSNNINPEAGKDFITLAENPASGDFFIGSMSQFMIWDQVLSAAEIKSLAF